MPVFRVTGGVLNVKTVGEGGPVDPDYDIPSERPTHPIYYPPGIWGPNDPRPTPPMVLPIPPDAIAPGVPSHPIYLPVFPAHPIVIPPGALAPGTPTHPIYLPPIIWGPGDPRPTPPIVIPPGIIDGIHPEHPIYIPPVIWGPGDPRPTPPIFIPLPPTGPGGEAGGKWVYTPLYGWVWDPGEGGKPQPLPPK